MITQDDYLDAVRRELRDLDARHREAVLADLREHFADATEQGRSPEEISRALGTPREISERAYEEFGRSGSTAERLRTVLTVAAIVVAVVTAVFVAFLLPSYTVADGTGDETAETLAAYAGFAAALVTLVPALVVTVPLVVPRRARGGTSLAVAIVLTLMAVVGGFTIGGFAVPIAMLAWAAVVVPRGARRGGFGVVSHIVGAMLVVSPFAVLTRGILTGTVGLSAWGIVVVVVITAVAVLIGFGVRAAGWLLLVIGAAVMIATLVFPSMLAVALWAMGGLYVTIGLSHAVAPVRARISPR
ncbi:DUF1700 domain-containing protein [Microbacterium horticulturae]|uniref:DUF1700 domain-containing protein n=1 Tax=Microbacterium horticulturae TaxID=3028316 RepID=A0ABY8BYJ9_9MICO|nr:DUF1700 domain-containing protein [Microbacterium sp. KACC 23027]WEG09269.1 DUF1700 domain-containing protein [Microbacterium sp. KACC 23027]